IQYIFHDLGRLQYIQLSLSVMHHPTDISVWIEQDKEGLRKALAHASGIVTHDASEFFNGDTDTDASLHWIFAITLWSDSMGARSCNSHTLFLFRRNRCVLDA